MTEDELFNDPLIRAMGSRLASELPKDDPREAARIAGEMRRKFLMAGRVMRMSPQLAEAANQYLNVNLPLEGPAAGAGAAESSPKCDAAPALLNGNDLLGSLAVRTPDSTAEPKDAGSAAGQLEAYAIARTRAVANDRTCGVSQVDQLLNQRPDVPADAGAELATSNPIAPAVSNQFGGQQ